MKKMPEVLPARWGKRVELPRGLVRPGWPWAPEFNDRVLESKDAGGKEQESNGKEPEQPNDEEPTPEEEPEEEKEKDEVETEEKLISELLALKLWAFVKELKVFLFEL